MAVKPKAIKPLLSLADTLRQYTGKKVAVPFSGGLDSTVLICGLLEAGAYVQSVGITYNRSPAMWIQRACRMKMVKAIAEKYGEDHYSHGETSLLDDLPNPKFASDRFDDRWLTQPNIWLSVMDCTMAAGIEYVAVGYVMGDDAVSFLGEIESSWDGRMALRYSHPRLTFPLLKQSKVALSKHSKQLHSSIHKWIYTCENIDDFAAISHVTPTWGHVCGRCPTCKKEMSLGIYRNDPFGPFKIFDTFNGLSEHRDFFKEKRPKYVTMAFSGNDGRQYVGLFANSYDLPRKYVMVAAHGIRITEGDKFLTEAIERQVSNHFWKQDFLDKVHCFNSVEDATALYERLERAAKDHVKGASSLMNLSRATEVGAPLINKATPNESTEEVETETLAIG